MIPRKIPQVSSTVFHCPFCMICTKYTAITANSNTIPTPIIHIPFLLTVSPCWFTACRILKNSRPAGNDASKTNGFRSEYIRRLCIWRQISWLSKNSHMVQTRPNPKKEWVCIIGNAPAKMPAIQKHNLLCRLTADRKKANSGKRTAHPNKVALCGINILAMICAHLKFISPRLVGV